VIYEGCGSVAYAKLFAPVRRPEKITIEALDENGNIFRLSADGMLARVIQHEFDHLNGIEFTEKITDMRKIMSSEEYRKRMVIKKP
jgi:peptide deformylase